MDRERRLKVGRGAWVSTEVGSETERMIWFLVEDERDLSVSEH